MSNPDLEDFRIEVNKKLLQHYGINHTTWNEGRGFWVLGITWMAFHDPSPSIARTAFIIANAVQGGHL